MGKIYIKEGMVFGELTVLSLNKEESEKPRGEDGHKVKYWNCQCSCGKKVIVRGWCLTRRTNSTKSCGNCEDRVPTPIMTYLRGLNVVNNWKKEAKERAKGYCEISGEKIKKGEEEVHHIHPFKTIVIEAHEKNNIEIKENHTDYTEEELNKIVEYVTYWHENIDNAIVLSKSVHKMFHNDFMGGTMKKTTEKDFESFKKYYEGYAI